MPRHDAFTIFEMLVVVLIILVLIAILIPGLDRVIYQAELTTCSARLGQIAQGVRTYASANDRAYPYRTVVRDNGSGPEYLRVMGKGNDRPVLRKALGPLQELLVDPLASGSLGDDSINATVRSSYALWFGFAYQGHDGMLRVNDTLQYQPAGQGLVRSRVLVSDINLWDSTTGAWWSSHPDSAGLLRLIAWYDDKPLPTAFQPDGMDTEEENEPSPPEIFNVWAGTSGVGPMIAGTRGSVDYQYATDDGSTSRITRVFPNDPRMIALPAHADPTRDSTRHHYLPRSP